MNEFRLLKLLRSGAGVSDLLLADLNHESVKSGVALEDLVVRRGVLTRPRLYELLARELNIPYVDLAAYLLDQELLKTVPADVCRRHRVVPLFRVNGRFTFVTSNPDDIAAVDELQRLLECEISLVLTEPDSLNAALDEHYPAESGSAIQDAAVAIEADQALRFIESEQKAKSLEQLAGEAPVVRFVNSILEQALSDRASDVHIEPEADHLLVRMRVDGILRESGRFPGRLHAAVTSRVKILAGMDISDKRRPQDGRFNLAAGGRQVDIRVSSFPTIYGENVVLRLLDKAAGLLRLSELGLAPDVERRFAQAFAQPHGLILVTGPTGSGKTTTLYSVLRELNTSRVNIMTLEDPVEYRLPGTRQCQVNAKAGVTFASGLRSVLRQDPDVILVGEIRDAETAEIAFQAALTGHLVLATLHTNDAASALTRLVDMNVEPFLIASSVLCVVAQRLCRRICPRCRSPHEPERGVLARLGLEDGNGFCIGTGCPVCGRSGYRGRLGVYELLAASPATRRLVMERRSADEIRAAALAEGMRTMRDDALAKARQGLTALEEVLRVTQDCG